MALILWAAGGMAFVARQPVLGLVIWAIVLVNAALTFWREYRAQQAMQALHQLLPTYAVWCGRV
jgi:Ca2+-transporting ATPase